DRGIRTAVDRTDDAWSFRSYADLAVDVRRVAGGLADRGVGAGGRMAVILRSRHDFAAVLFGGWLVGAAATPIAPPATFRSDAGYRAHLRAVVAESAADVIVTE